MWKGVKGSEPAAGTPTEGQGTRPGARTGKSSAICCAACGAHITTEDERIAVAGSHEHRFVNPGGYTFHLGCFAGAVGVVVVGPDSGEYPWFPGHRWRYAHCGACGMHLGWQFRGKGGGNFLGLVLNRLRVLDI